MNWQASYKADPRAREIADRHYNRQKIGAPQFAPPGRALVLFAPGAFWITSYPFAQYVRHAWAGAWVCSAFRNERPDLYRSSDLIREAIQKTIEWCPEVPALGMITFVDSKKTAPKNKPGWCYRKAGFRHVGFTKGGLYALQWLP